MPLYRLGVELCARRCPLRRSVFAARLRPSARSSVRQFKVAALINADTAPVPILPQRPVSLSLSRLSRRHRCFSLLACTNTPSSLVKQTIAIIISMNSTEHWLVCHQDRMWLCTFFYWGVVWTYKENVIPLDHGYKWNSGNSFLMPHNEQNHLYV